MSLINSADGKSLGSIIANGFGGALLAAWIGGINIIQAIAGFVFLPLEAFGFQLVGVVQAFIGGIAGIIQTGAETAQQAILPGQAWAVGPLTFALAIGAAGIGIFVMSELLGRAETSNLIPGSFTDVPFVGVDEDEETDE